MTVDYSMDKLSSWAWHTKPFKNLVPTQPPRCVLCHSFPCTLTFSHNHSLDLENVMFFNAILLLAKLLTLPGIMSGPSTHPPRPSWSKTSLRLTLTHLGISVPHDFIPPWLTMIPVCSNCAFLLHHLMCYLRGETIVCSFLYSPLPIGWHSTYNW